MYRPYSEEIYSKLTICDFLLTVNSIPVTNNHGRIAYRLRDIFAYSLNIAIFSHCIVIVDSVASTSTSNINITYTSMKSILVGYNLSLTIRVYLHSFSLTKSRKIPRKFGLIAHQGYPRSSILVPSESYFLLAINNK